MLDLEDLSTFVEVADAGGVTAAARRLGLPKSIVSRRLVRLEQDLGAQLLTRTTRGAALTEAGASFREHAARVVAELEAAREAISPEGEVCGRLRIAAPLTFGPTHLAPVLADLARRHPKLQVHAAYSDRFVDLVGEGFDAAVRLGYLPDSNLVARRVAPLRGKCVASPEYVKAHGAPARRKNSWSTSASCRAPSRGGSSRTARRSRCGRKEDSKPKWCRARGRRARRPGHRSVAGLPRRRTHRCRRPRARARRLSATGGRIYVVRPPGEFAPRKVRALIDILVERFGGGSA